MATLLEEETAVPTHEVPQQLIGEESMKEWRSDHDELCCYSCNYKYIADLGEGLLLGASDNADCPYRLQSLGITHVLRVMNDFHQQPRPEMWTEFRYMTIDVDDYETPDQAEKLAASFEDAIAFISEGSESSKGKVYVHCWAGRSRSPTVCAAYLMKERGLSLSEAMAHIQRVRPHISPNDGFVWQLVRFEKKLQEAARTEAARLRREGNRTDAKGQRIVQAAAEVVEESEIASRMERDLLLGGQSEEVSAEESEADSGEEESEVGYDSNSE